MLNSEKLKKDFPIFRKKINGRPLVYLDSAATSQRPRLVINAVNDFYEKYNANIHRGIYQLSEEATALYEGAREKVRKFIGARHKEEVVFTRGATESINLVAYAWGRNNIKKGDIILITEMEHHSNLIPWQQLVKEKGAKLAYIPVNKQGRLDLKNLNQLLKNAKLLALTHVSNVLGTVNPVREIIKKAHAKKVLVLVDGAQAVPHIPVDVSKLDCDFYAFSGHKMLGPTGIGVLYAKKEILEKMPPFLTGGGMIREVSKQHAVWEDLPWKFEAGTMPLAEAVGLGAAIDYLGGIGMDNILRHEQKLIAYALKNIKTIPEVIIYGPQTTAQKCGVLAFNIKNIHPHDLATILDQKGLAIRVGHHCAKPLLESLGVKSTARASFYLYNNEREIDQFIIALKLAIKIFQ